MALLDTLIAFIPMLGILIFVHELGHYLVARACGVRVLTFSLGFGPPIGFGDYRLRWERGGTEYRVGLRNFYAITRYNHSHLYARATRILQKRCFFSTFPMFVPSLSW